MSGTYETPEERQARQRLDRLTAESLGIDLDLLDDFGFDYEESEGKNGTPPSYRISWHLDAPPGVPNYQIGGQRYTDLDLLDFDDEDAAEPDWLADMLAQEDEGVPIPDSLVQQWSELAPDKLVTLTISRAACDDLLTSLRDIINQQQQLLLLSLALARNDFKKAEDSLKEYGTLVVETSRRIDRVTRSILETALKDTLRHGD